MNRDNFFHALLSSLIAMVVYIFTTVYYVQLFGTDSAKGIVGLYMFAIIYVPFLMVITLPLIIILSKFIMPKKRALKVLYALAVIIPFLLGIFSGTKLN